MNFNYLRKILRLWLSYKPKNQIFSKNKYLNVIVPGIYYFHNFLIKLWNKVEIDCVLNFYSQFKCISFVGNKESAIEEL